MRITKPLLLIVPAMALSGLLFWSCGGDTDGAVAAKTPRNLVIIVSDALRRDMLGCYGGEVKTPHIDRLAREGTLFENAYSTAPCTMPSAVSMLTGCYARTFTFDTRQVRRQDRDGTKRSYFFRVGDGIRLLAEALREKGFVTRAAVENGLVQQCNLLQGYRIITAESPLSETSRLRLTNELGFVERNDAYARQAVMLDFLLTVPENQPFAALIWIYDPHGPYDPAPEFRCTIPINAADLPRPESFYTTAKQRELRNMLQAGELSPQEVLFLRRLYQAEIASMDERVGYVLKALEKNGRIDETLIVFASDHGESLGEHLHFGHALAVYQELIRVPLIFRGPGIPRGKKESTIVSHLDLSPTLRELMVENAPEQTQGTSYAGLFRGREISRRFLYFDWFSNALNKNWIGVDAALDMPFKLIAKRGQGKLDFTLHDLARDPGEELNLAQELNQEVKRIFARIYRLRKENQRLMHRHVRLLEGNIDTEKEIQEATKLLKSLGYL
ncbi:MAG: sulfatase [Acidobacteriota bacterium]|jgi:arylsulfatase A-like enzyme|nr:sulfatase [Acidobacteriota bacterium]